MRKLLGALASIAFVAIFAAPAANAQSAGATIMLLHGIPATPVDVEVNGAVAVPNFQFGQMQNLSSLSGTTLTALKVKLAGTSTVAIDAGTVALPATGTYTIVAHRDAAGAPKLSVFNNDIATLAAGKGRLTVRHTAAAPAVDVRANGAVAFAALTNPNEAKADLAVGTISATVVPAGAATPVVIGPANLAIADGTSLIVYAVGSLTGNTLQVLTQSISGLGTAPTRVDTGNSPVSDGSSSSTLVLVSIVVMIGLLGGGVATARRVRG